MRYISVFSGIEAASCAFGPLGMEPVAFSEVDDHASGVPSSHIARRLGVPRRVVNKVIREAVTA